jgi:aldehyde dehydrogenase (NAD+)
LFKDHEGTVVYGNANAHNDKNLTPSIILNPSPDSPLMQDEIFGPILPIITTASIDEAISFVRARDKPLAAYYFGSNSSRNANLMRCKNEISTGCFSVNEVGLAMANSDLPFGGVGASGMGRYHGKEGFVNCSNKKSILMKTPIKSWPADVVFPPFTKSKQSLFKFAEKRLDITQRQLVKRIITFWLLIFILWYVVSGRAKKFWKKVKFAWKMIKMMNK